MRSLLFASSLVTLAVAGFVKETEIGPWRLRVFTDPMTDAKGIALILSATDELPKIKARLQLSCPGGTDILLFRADRPFVDGPARVRFDADPPVTLKVLARDAQLYVDDPGFDLNKVFRTGYGRMVVEFPKAQNDPARAALASFDLRDAAKAFGAYRQYCPSK